MFQPHEHEYVGARRAYIPQGFAPVEWNPHIDRATILPAGDTVTVLSAWTRPYLPGGGETLLYVESNRTGERTHVTATDLPLGAE